MHRIDARQIFGENFFGPAFRVGIKPHKIPRGHVQAGMMHQSKELKAELPGRVVNQVSERDGIVTPACTCVELIDEASARRAAGRK